MNETLESYSAIVEDKNNDIYERISALLYIPKLHDPDAIYFFLTCLKDESPDIRSYAINAMTILAQQETGLPNHINIEAVLSKVINYDELVVQLSAIYALGFINTEKSINIVIKLLGDHQSEIRIASANALYYLAPFAAIQPLIALLTDDNIFVQVAVINTLAKIGDNKAVEPLILLLSSDRDRIRKEAIIALKKLADRRAVKPLITLLQVENSGQVKIAIIEALGILHDIRAIFPIVRYLNSQHKFVRAAARSALAHLIKSFFILKV